MTEPKGFYPFTPAELRDLSAVNPASIDEEIKMVRINMRRMLKLSKHQPVEEQIRTLCLCSATSARLASLLRTQKELNTGRSGESELYHLIDSTLDQVLLDQGWPTL